MQHSSVAFPESVRPIFTEEDVRGISDLIELWKAIETSFADSVALNRLQKLSGIEERNKPSQFFIFARMLLFSKYAAYAELVKDHVRYLRSFYEKSDFLLAKLNQSMRERILFNSLRNMHTNLLSFNVISALDDFSRALAWMQTDAFKTELATTLTPRFSFTILPNTLDPSLHGKITVKIKHSSPEEFELHEERLKYFSAKMDLPPEEYYEKMKAFFYEVCAEIVKQHKEIFVSRFGHQLRFTIQIITAFLNNGNEDNTAARVDWTMLDEKLQTLTMYIDLFYLLNRIRQNEVEGMKTMIIHELHHVFDIQHLIGARGEALTTFAEFVYTKKVHYPAFLFEKYDMTYALQLVRRIGMDPVYPLGLYQALLLYAANLKRTGISLSAFSEKAFEEIIQTPTGKEIAEKTLKEIRLMDASLFERKAEEAERWIKEDTMSRQ